MNNLWICLAVMILVTTIILFLVKNPDSESFSFMNSFALVTVIIIQRDFGIEKNRISTRYDIYMQYYWGTTAKANIFYL